MLIPNNLNEFYRWLKAAADNAVLGDFIKAHACLRNAKIYKNMLPQHQLVPEVYKNLNDTELFIAEEEIETT